MWGCGALELGEGASAAKNSGPYEITLDILFDDPKKYRRVVDSGCITRESVAQLYHLPPERAFLEFVRDAALGDQKSPICATCPPGTVGDCDVYGAQQHAP